MEQQISNTQFPQVILTERIQERIANGESIPAHEVQPILSALEHLRAGMLHVISVHTEAMTDATASVRVVSISKIAHTLSHAIAGYLGNAVNVGEKKDPDELLRQALEAIDKFSKETSDPATLLTKIEFIHSGEGNTAPPTHLAQVKLELGSHLTPGFEEKVHLTKTELAAAFARIWQCGPVHALTDALAHKSEGLTKNIFK